MLDTVKVDNSDEAMKEAKSETRERTLMIKEDLKSPHFIHLLENITTIVEISSSSSSNIIMEVEEEIIVVVVAEVDTIKEDLIIIMIIVIIIATKDTTTMMKIIKTKIKEALIGESCTQMIKNNLMKSNSINREIVRLQERIKRCIHHGSD